MAARRPRFTTLPQPTMHDSRLLVHAYLLRAWLTVQFPERLGKTLAWQLIYTSPRRGGLRHVVAMVPRGTQFAVVDQKLPRQHRRPSSLYAAFPDRLVWGC